MLSTIKRLIPLKVKRIIRDFAFRDDIRLPSSKRAFVFLAADYGNIGDIAITAAQMLYLKKTLGSFHVVHVPISRTAGLVRSIKRQINPGDLVTIVGGGNMGSLYPDIERLRQLVIKSFPANRVVCFPQTLDWSESSDSLGALERITRVYSRHPNLHVFARESITYKKLEDLFRPHPNVRVGYAPDIVLSATATELGGLAQSSSGILLCLRDDAERAIDSSQRGELQSALSCTGHLVEFTDTHAGGSGLEELHCARLLADKLNQFTSAKLVVTDRLHGMILSVIAGTPCLVLPNSNHKIHQTWKDWLKSVPQVKYLEVDDLATLPEVITELLTVTRRDTGITPCIKESYDELSRATTQW